MDPLVARFREIADDLALYKPDGWVERAAYYRGLADCIEHAGRTVPDLTETTDY